VFFPTRYQMTFRKRKDIWIWNKKSSRSHTVENSIWKRFWIDHKTDYAMNDPHVVRNWNAGSATSKTASLFITSSSEAPSSDTDCYSS
jgi:hypothetical protein